MITILWISTAGCFVLWILAEVRPHIYKKAWDNEIEYCKLVQVDCDKLRDERDDMRVSRDSYADQRDQAEERCKKLEIERNELCTVIVGFIEEYGSVEPAEEKQSK